MEIVDFLQLVLLLGLLAAVAILLISLRAARQPNDKQEKDVASKRNQSRSAPARTLHRPRNDLNRQMDRRLVSG